MSRHGYIEDLDSDQMNLWRGSVVRATRGKRGQKLLKDLLAALDAMPVKRLIVNSLLDADGEVCALGSLGKVRGLDLASIDPEDYDGVAEAFDVAPSLVREIEWVNDEHIAQMKKGWEWVECTTPESRWRDVRKWVASQIISPPAGEAKP